MKTKILVAAWLLSTCNAQLSTCFAQGSLTPPGAPAPTMKTLDQIEARTPVSSAPYTISVPGSYYLTTNVSVSSGDAITIATNNVMLDLNGFTIYSTAASAGGTAILVNGTQNITIRNGNISSGVTNYFGTFSGSGFANGVYSPAASAEIHVNGLMVSGCLTYGIYLPYGLGYLGGSANSTMAESCTVQNIGGTGILASMVSHSTAALCGSDAVVADNASDCWAYSLSGYGIRVQYTANDCFGRSGLSHGVGANTANNCCGYSDESDGLNVTTANDCYGYNSSDGYGLIADAANNCHGESFQGTGLYAGVATGCRGVADDGDNDGLYAQVAINSFGSNPLDGTGLEANYIAIGCLGQSNGGTGLKAYIANSSYGHNGGGTSENVTYKNNMP